MKKSLRIFFFFLLSGYTCVAQSCAYCDSVYNASTTEPELEAWTLFSEKCLHADTVYYSAEGNVLSKKTRWEYYEIISKDSCAIFYSLERFVQPSSVKQKNVYFQVYKGDTTYFKIVEPQFTGGEPALLKFFQQNLIYPPKAMKAGVQGLVWVHFFVEKDGTVSEIALLRGTIGDLNEAALRFVNLMPPWIPGLYRNKVTRSRVEMPIRFRLNDED